MVYKTDMSLDFLTLGSNTWNESGEHGHRRTHPRNSGAVTHTRAGLGSQGLHCGHGVHDDALGELRPGWWLAIDSDDVPQTWD